MVDNMHALAGPQASSSAPAALSLVSAFLPARLAVAAQKGGKYGMYCRLPHGILKFFRGILQGPV